MSGVIKRGLILFNCFIFPNISAFATNLEKVDLALLTKSLSETADLKEPVACASLNHCAYLRAGLPSSF